MERFCIQRKTRQHREVSLHPKWRRLGSIPKAIRGCFLLQRVFPISLASGPKTFLLLFPEAEIFNRWLFLHHTVVKKQTLPDKKTPCKDQLLIFTSSGFNLFWGHGIFQNLLKSMALFHKNAHAKLQYLRVFTALWSPSLEPGEGFLSLSKLACSISWLVLTNGV